MSGLNILLKFNLQVFGFFKWWKFHLLIHVLKYPIFIQYCFWNFTYCTSIQFSLQRKNHQNVFILCVSEKCNVNITNTKGCTPLMFAATFRNLEICKLLVSHGADLNQVWRNKCGFKVWEFWCPGHEMVKGIECCLCSSVLNFVCASVYPKITVAGVSVSFEHNSTVNFGYCKLCYNDFLVITDTFECPVLFDSIIMCTVTKDWLLWRL